MPRAPFIALVFVACSSTQDVPDSSTPDASDDVALDASQPEIVVDASPDVADVQKPTGNIVRIMSANITSGTKQAYEDPGIRIFQGLHPDVVLIQEFNYATGQRALVDAAFGTQFSYFVEPSGNIPNGVVSRFPILDSGTWTDASTTDRGFAWALIDIPGPIDLFAVSLHLLTSSITARDTEAKQVVSLVQANAPQSAFVVIGGDLNTDATNESAIVDFGSITVVTPPFPVDQLQNNNTSTNRNRPHDWVLASPNLEQHKVDTWIGNSIYPAGLVFDSRVYTPMTEVAPALATDSAEPGMQHMPVVRDFSF